MPAAYKALIRTLEFDVGETLDALFCADGCQEHSGRSRIVLLKMEVLHVVLNIPGHTCGRHGPYPGLGILDLERHPAASGNLPQHWIWI